ncbi:hypothetical protein AVEN_8394-1, partial [Araneus ventricosus]
SSPEHLGVPIEPPPSPHLPSSDSSRIDYGWWYMAPLVLLS